MTETHAKLENLPGWLNAVTYTPGTANHQVPMEGITSPRQYASGSSTRIEDMPVLRWRPQDSQRRLNPPEPRPPSDLDYGWDSGMFVEDKTPCEEHFRYDVNGIKVALSMASEESAISPDRSSLDYSEFFDDKLTVPVHLVIPANTVSNREVRILLSRLYQGESTLPEPPALAPASFSSSHDSATRISYPGAMQCPDPAVHVLAEEAVDFMPLTPQRVNAPGFGRAETSFAPNIAHVHIEGRQEETVHGRQRARSRGKPGKVTLISTSANGSA